MVDKILTIKNLHHIGKELQYNRYVHILKKEQIYYYLPSLFRLINNSKNILSCWETYFNTLKIFLPPPPPLQKNKCFFRGRVLLKFLLFEARLFFSLSFISKEKTTSDLWISDYKKLKSFCDKKKNKKKNNISCKLMMTRLKIKRGLWDLEGF